jgi:hypothetical protein
MRRSLVGAVATAAFLAAGAAPAAADCARDEIDLNDAGAVCVGGQIRVFDSGAISRVGSITFQNGQPDKLGGGSGIGDDDDDLPSAEDLIDDIFDEVGLDAD